MASLPIFNRSGAEVGKYEVDLAEIAPGTSKKMYRQKGTGNARAGSRRSPIRRGGGHAHSLLPRDYTYRLPRKAVQAATRMAIASKIKDNELVVIDDLAFTAPKT